MTNDDNHKKILFRFYSDALDKETSENLWAKTVDKDKGLYQLDSIPFYAPNIACGDIFSADYDPDENCLIFREIVSYSGHSTVQVVLMDKNKTTDEIRHIFTVMGCPTEKYSEGYFSIDIPKTLNYKIIKNQFTNLFKTNTIDYTESCLSDEHGRQVSGI